MDKAKQKTISTFFLLLTFSLFFFSPSFSQSVETETKEEPSPKWLERWREFETKRLNPDGKPARPDIFLSEAVKVSDQKIQASFRSSSPTWIPTGPAEKPSIYSSSLNGGMGRINCIAFHPTDSNTFFVGVAQGGVWKTADGGQNWIPLTDDLPILRISDIAIDTTNPDILYISVGDYAYLGAGLDLDDRKRHTHYGLGVYKTIDGGQSWNPTGLTFSQTQRNESLIRRVLIDPKDNNHLIAGGITGIYNSTDAGANWTLVHDSLIWDLIADPSSNRTLYAASGYVKNMDEGYAGILKSTDFGSTWTELNTGIPKQNQVQRIKLAISPQDSNYVYAIACNMDRGFYGLYRTTDGGSSWTQRSNTPNVLHWYEQGSGTTGQGTYDLSLLVNPNNKDIIYSGGINMWGSTDGGSTWEGASFFRNFYGPSLHADIHFYDFNHLSQTYFVCHDGGLSTTKQINIDGFAAGQWTTQWTDLMDMQITSFYRMGIAEGFPGYYIAGSQDNSTYYRDGSVWSNIIGGDGMDCVLHPSNPSEFYASAQYGAIYHSTNGGVTYDYISGQPRNSEQGAWTTPFMLDPQNPSIFYAGFGNVWRTSNKGQSWTKLSNFPNSSLGYPTPIVGLDISGSTIFAASRLYFSLGELSKFWVGTNNGSSWTEVTNGLPDSLFFTSVDAIGSSGQDVFVSIGGFKNGEKVYRSTDAGTTWQNISYDLPNIPINSIKYLEGSSHGTVFAGTDVGVFISNDTLNSWVPFGAGLPNVIVSDLEIDYSQDLLFAATFGRGIWEVDISNITIGFENPGSLVKSNLIVFPNPSHGEVKWKLDNYYGKTASVKVVDIMGRKRFAETVVVDHEMPINTELGFGKYYLVIEVEGQRFVRTFLID